MSNLPNYYFRDIPAETMKEVMDGMQAVKPEPRLEDIEEANDWLVYYFFKYRHNSPRTIPQWYEAVGEFLSDVRAEYHR